MDTFVLRRRRRPRSVGRRVHPVPHGFADPSRASAIKRVSAAAYRILVDASGIADGSPTLRGPGAVCRQCLRVKARAERGDGDGGERARGAARLFASDGGALGTPGSKRRFSSTSAWLRAARVEDRSGAASAVSTGPTRGLACAHGRLRPDAKGRRGSRGCMVATTSRGFGKRRRRLFPVDVASVRESPPRTTFRTTTRVGFEPVTSATTMTTFASSRKVQRRVAVQRVRRNGAVDSGSTPRAASRRAHREQHLDVVRSSPSPEHPRAPQTACAESRRRARRPRQQQRTARARRAAARRDAPPRCFARAPAIDPGRRRVLVAEFRRASRVRLGARSSRGR